MKVGFIGVGKLGRDVTEVMAEYHEDATVVRNEK